MRKNILLTERFKNKNSTILCNAQRKSNSNERDWTFPTPLDARGDELFNNGCHFLLSSLKFTGRWIAPEVGVRTGTISMVHGSLKTTRSQWKAMLWKVWFLGGQFLAHSPLMILCSLVFMQIQKSIKSRHYQGALDKGRGYGDFSSSSSSWQ